MLRIEPHTPAKLKHRSNASISARTVLSCEPLEERMMLSVVDIYAAGSTGEETMQVRLFDEVLATFENVGGDANAGVFEKYSFEVDFEGGELGDIDDLFIVFTNDLYIEGGVDRNLRVDAIVLSEFEGSTDTPIRYETEDAAVYSTGTWKPEDGVVRGYRESEYLHSNGFFNFSGQREGGTRVLIQAEGSEGGEQFDLQVDGQTVETFTVTQNSQTFSWEAPEDQRVDYDQVRIVFTNDLYDPANGIDRNLIVDDVQVGRFSLRDNAVVPARSSTVFSTGSWRPEDGIVPGIRFSDTLHTNGYFQFGVFDAPNAFNPDVIYTEEFEASGNAGFTFDPFGTDTADRGQFEIGVPESTSINSVSEFQLGGGIALATGLSAGTGIGSNDVDGGVTSALSPEFFLPAGSNSELRVAYSFAHTSSATADDQLRIGILVEGQVVNILQETGNNGFTRNGAFTNFTASLEDFAGKTVQLLFEAEDSSNTVVEASIASIFVGTV